MCALLKKPSLIVVLLSMFALAGCGSLLKTEYQAPNLPVATDWQAMMPVDSLPARDWWSVFTDADLNALVGRVLASNGDLAAAGIRLNQARLSSELAGKQLYPSVSASLGSSGNRPLENDRGWSRSSSASLGVSWEVDLFGRLQSERDASRWEELASAEDLEATRLSLIAMTVRAYWQLAYANDQIRIGEQSISYTEQALELVRLQYAAGGVSLLDLREAEQSLAAQQATQTRLVQARVEARNALAVLLGQQLYDGPEPETLASMMVPTLAAGLPAELISRRPDLKRDELRLRSLLASVDATRASFYPNFRLTGDLGAGSNELFDFLSNPIAYLSGTLAAPLLNFDRIALNVDISKAQYEAATALFRQTFYQAIGEVENALSARIQYAAEAEFLEASYAAARDAEGLYERQYRAGAIPIRQWLDAQQRRRNAENAVLGNIFNRLDTEVTLYQALGG